MNMDSVKEEIKTFVDSLVPGNYFLTKSMELSKVRNSGTLWYTKKFLVLYYYIFLYKNIEVRDTVVEICIIFDEYIASLPEKLRVNAEEFFYSGYPTANLKSPDFRLFDDFAGNAIFDSEKEKRDYAEFAKKYYFAFLMESGGQSGVKREIKEHLYKKEFCCRDLDNIINGYCDRNGWGGNTLISIKNDYMAFLRNERQILFYYGFVHSKTNGSKDVEFSSLTPIGELALHSNYYELIAIWEHQKVKMLSQPVTVDINNIDSKVEYGTENFKVNTAPYLTILENMHKGDGFTFEQYQYVISRIEEHQDSQLLFDDDSMTMIREKVNSFERDADVTPEDFTKELKKYLLGIRDDLKMDKG